MPDDIDSQFKEKCMPRLRLSPVILSILLTMLAYAHASGDDPLDRALAEVGLTRETARFDPLDMEFFGSDEFKLPIFDVLVGDPWDKASRHMKAYRDSCIELA
ncbi:MAG: hypothetical protein L0213_09195, partial [Candidatus Dadabacteria bacterium]|nr:hypothetical protein [Candidatus Dadabacteria bacterium]